MKTEGIKSLVEEVLATITKPADDVIRDVFLEIRLNGGWRRRYGLLCDDLGKEVVNAWGGRYVRLALGRPPKKGRADAGANALIESYTILDSRYFQRL